MVLETEGGAYVAPGPKLKERARLAAADPHFDVLEGDGLRYLFAKCSRLPDDEEPAAGRFGIDFHRALPPFSGDSPWSLDLGRGPVPVNAYTYAQHLPRALRFREFTANVAFAARTREEYEAKRRVYKNFYDHLYRPGAALVVAAPHSGEVRRRPDEFHPFPKSETDAWTARVAVRLAPPPVPEPRRVLLSLHSTDYFGALLDVGDFGLPQNHRLPEIIARLKKRFAPDLLKVFPAYLTHKIPYTLERLKWFERHFGTLDPRRLSGISTAARFEIKSIFNLIRPFMDPARGFTLAGIARGLKKYRPQSGVPLIMLNGIFSGRKTARLLNLVENLQQASFFTAVQVEVSRFLAERHPDLAAAVISELLQAL